MPALPPATAPSINGAFAFADSSGTQLLALDSVPDRRSILGAVCFGGMTVSVTYDRLQEANAADTGRQLAYNFGNQRGHVFRVARDRAPGDGTCFLSPDSLLLANARAVTKREPAACSPAHAARITAEKRREVIHCWKIGEGATGLEVLAVQFAHVDTTALASLILAEGGTMVFKDFPAAYRGPDDSVWRVDDGGVFSPENLEILFTASMPYGQVVVFTWAGPEGEYSETFVSGSRDGARTVRTGYRYWVPL